MDERYQLANIRIGIDEAPDSASDLAPFIGRLLGIPAVAIRRVKILKKAVDARKRNRIAFVYTLEFSTEPPWTSLRNRADIPGAAVSKAVPSQREPLPRGSEPMAGRPLVVGAGPAGLFCALKLAEHGYMPLVIERGDEAVKRRQAVAAFWNTGALDPESNVQYGEGGAGTFSDGKLTTRIKDPRISEVLDHMVRAGAPPEILYESKPHIGTDILVDVVTNLRKEIVSLGGEARFRLRLADLVIDKGRVAGVQVEGPASDGEIPGGVTVLALGNSARDTFEMLRRRGVGIEAKAISVGVRIEHPQALIDIAQYGPYAGDPRLGPADYQLSFRDDATGRAAYTFCMCPGGYVVAAASEEGMVATNGMSESGRDSGIANSALVVSVTPEDYGDYRADPLAGVEFQRRLERRAFEAGGGGFKAPCQTLGDFVRRRIGGLDKAFTRRGAAAPTYRPGVTEADIWGILPHYVCDHMVRALGFFDGRVRGFSSDDAVLTAVESRTSCPVRMPRDEATLQAYAIEGLYPCGEGAGYAGGIMSAAVDGIRVAERIIRKYAKPSGL